jgi:hypothetical protein
MTHYLPSEVQECYSGAYSVTFALVISIIFYLGTNITILIQNKVDPRIRQRLQRINSVVTVSEFIINKILVFVLLFTWNPFFAECDPNDNLYNLDTLYRFCLIPYVIFVGTEITVCVLFLIFLTVGLILTMCGIIARDPIQTNDPGKPYVDERTEVDTFKNILNKIGISFPGQSDKDEEEKEMKCAICYDDYQEDDILRKMPCDHYFHKACIDVWMEKRSECPICNQDIRTAESQFAKTSPSQIEQGAPKININTRDTINDAKSSDEPKININGPFEDIEISVEPKNSKS